MNYFKILISFAFISISTASFSITEVLQRDDQVGSESPRSPIFDRVLSHEKNTGYAGVLPISNVNGKNYVLLSQERKNGSATGTYCDGGGKVDKGETMLTAALREFYEESSRVYDYRDKAEDVKRNSSIHSRNSLLTVFLDVDYKKRQEFLNALAEEKKKSKNYHFYEKSDFLWVDVDHLYHSLDRIKAGSGHPSLDVKVLNDDGTITDQTIKLRDFFARTLKNSEEILKKYCTNETSVATPLTNESHKNSEEISKKNSPKEASAVDQTPIQEIRSLKEISTKNFKKKTLVLLDLDENIILEKGYVQSKYRHLIGKKNNYRLIEPDIATTIRNLKSSVNNNPSNVVVLGLTRRGIKKHGRLDMAHKYLERNRVPLSRKRFRRYNGLTWKGNSNAGFYNGVIHSAGKKRECLEKFLKDTGFDPSLIVMSDDKRENLEEIKNFAHEIGVPMEAYEMVGAKDLR